MWVALSLCVDQFRLTVLYYKNNYYRLQSDMSLTFPSLRLGIFLAVPGKCLGLSLPYLYILIYTLKSTQLTSTLVFGSNFGVWYRVAYYHPSHPSEIRV